VTSQFSTSVGLLRKALEGQPDDYEVVITNCDIGDVEIAGLFPDRIIPPALDAPGLVVLEAGQEITMEYEYYPRLDVALEHRSGSISWNLRTEEWERR
jgi:hypothetical protein